ncbi:MAG TPA: hypothetical protein VNV66_20540 [Pilimelia sp.]|nr:hypothetical protein [Pilimelia sp.]
MSQDDQGAALQAAQMRVLEQFGAVCAAPDDPRVREDADRALRELDQLLAQAGRG